MLAAYAQYWRINLLTLFEYRANSIMWFFFAIVYHAVALGALYVTMRQFPSMNGWTFREMFLLYSLWMAGHELHNTAFFQVVSVPDFIREGQFDRFLVRPLDALFQIVTVPQQILPDGLLLALVTLGVAIPVSGLHPSALLVLVVALIVCGGALIDLGISLAVATVAFWVIRVDTLRWAVMSLEQDFTRYPISIYARGVRLVLAFVLPFAFMNYFPAAFLLGKTENGLGLNPIVGVFTPAIGLVMTAAAYLFWRVGLRHYQGTGS